MLRSIFKFIKYSLLTFIGLLLIMIAINWQDEEYLPIPEYADRHEIINKSDNAYYAIAGFNAAAGENMHVMGYKITQAFEQFVVDKDDSAFDVKQLNNASGLGFKGDESFLCKPWRDRQCLAKISNNKTALLELKKQNQHLYQRYRALIGYRKFLDDSYYIPSWSGIFNTHYLHLNLIGLEWQQGNKIKAISMLSETIRFNKLLFTESELLINHMVGLALYKNTLAFYAELHKECEDCRNVQNILFTIPQLNRNQICIKKPFIGELKYVKIALKKSEMTGLYFGDIQFGARLKNLWHQYFGQPGANFNNYNRKYKTILKNCEKQSYEITNLVDHQANELTFIFPWYSYAYNPAGKYMLEYGYGAIMNPYIFVSQVLELEGFIRLLKIQGKIHEDKVGDFDIATYLKQLPDNLKDPYTNKPVLYDKDSHSIYFNDEANTDMSGSQRIVLPL